MTSLKTISGEGRVRLLALLVMLLGLLNLWSALLARGPGRALFLHETVHLPLVITHASRTIVAIFGLGLLMLARSLARRKRQAWRLTLLMLIIAPFAHIAKGLDWEEALVCLALAGGLLWERNSFFAANDPPKARQGALAAASLFLFAAVYGPVGFFLLRHEYRPRVTISSSVLQTLEAISLVSEDPSYLQPRTKRGLWFENSLPLIAVFALGYGAFMLLRPVLPPLPLAERHARERALAQHLLQLWGGPPLSAFATLLADKRYLFSTADINAVPNWAIGYVLIGRHAVALGDPLGDPGKANEAITSFLTLCLRQDWNPVFYQVTDRFLPHYRSQSLKALRVGNEALISLPVFSLTGKRFQDLRTALNKAAKNNIALEDWNTRAFNEDPDTTKQLAAISEEWLRNQKGQEKTFALGHFDPASDLFQQSRLLLARETETRRILAFTTFVPIYGEAHHVVGWNLDLMRRADAALPGITEFLITSAALLFQKEGAEVLSLGLSPLSPSEDNSIDLAEDEMIARGRALLYERFNYFYSFHGLHAFKEKFAPVWPPRYLIYSSNTDLAHAIYAVVNAHSPGGLWRFLRK
jgi:phosphatidylglycerol lysyltransferase